MKKLFLIGALCFMALTEHADAKAVKLWTAGGDDGGRGLAVKEYNDRTICPKGKTRSGSGVCVNCDTVLSNCEWCSSTTVCTKCKKGYLVKDDKCEKEGCDTDSDCESNQSCDTVAHKCEKLDCPRGKYLSDHKCLSCPAECTECTSATVCTACKTNYELEGTECTQITCPTGQYVEHSACHPCSEAIENCGECITSKTCTKCENDMVLEYGKCVEPKCRSNEDCKDTEKCNDVSKLCEKVVCDEGYEVGEHTCLPIKGEDPECDENTDCEDDEVCVDGGSETAACVTLECKDPNQVVENHECVYKCGRDGEKVGTCAYLYNDCPSGWEQVSTAGYCKVCNPKQTYNGENCDSKKECDINTDCPNYYQVCSDHKCVNAPSCEDVRPPLRYRTGSQNATQDCGTDYSKVYLNVINKYCCVSKTGCTGYSECNQGSACTNGGCSKCTSTVQGSGAPYCNCPSGQCWSGSTCSSSACASGSSSSSSSGCTTHSQCPKGYECTGGNGCQKCESGSNLSLGNCNCPAGRYSTGDGSCTCSSNSDCRDEEYCNNGRCEGLSCGTYYCSRKNHQCVLCEYTCMLNSDCSKYSGIGRTRCINHICCLENGSCS